MALRARDAARFSVRPLLPGPEDALREAVRELGGDGLGALARHGAHEALAVQGLAADEMRVLERELRKLGGVALSNADGDRAVLLGPLAVIGALPGRLEEWGQRTEPLGAAIRAALAAKGSVPNPVAAGRHRLEFGKRTLVMGVVNSTPDSFSGDGVGDDTDAAVALGVAMAATGADIIDVGGESTRPNSQPISAAEELRRVLPVVTRLVAEIDVPVSIDSRKAEVVREAIAAGASVVNDIWGLRGDPEMAAVVAATDVALVAMHNRAGVTEGDVVAEIAAGLRQSLAVAADAGIAAERVIIDPGMGFAKTPAQNLELLRRLGELRGLGRPILVGASRKSTIGLILDGAPPEERLEGSLALAVVAAANGAHLVRVHDVTATVRALRVADAVIRAIPETLRALPAPGPTG